MPGYYQDMKTTLRKIPIRLPEELAVRLEQEADGRPLSRYVARLIEQALGASDVEERGKWREHARVLRIIKDVAATRPVRDNVELFKSELLRRLEAE